MLVCVCVWILFATLREFVGCNRVNRGRLLFTSSYFSLASHCFALGFESDRRPVIQCCIWNHDRGGE